MPSLKVPAKLRRQIHERAQGQCEYCYALLEYSPDPFAAEHIHPRADGGATTLDNLALSCLGCNNAKYTHITGYDEMTDETVPLYHPRRDRWDVHFAWEGIRIMPRSATGRVTIARLKLNRVGLLNLRTLLTVVGKHPPTPINDTK